MKTKTIYLDLSSPFINERNSMENQLIINWPMKFFKQYS